MKFQMNCRLRMRPAKSMEGQEVRPCSDRVCDPKHDTDDVSLSCDARFDVDA
jgi:hypothetical protein